MYMYVGLKIKSSHKRNVHESMTNVLISSIQAEAEELARRVDALTSENLLLKSEMNELAQNSEKLKMENAALKVMHTQNFLTPRYFIIHRRYFAILNIDNFNSGKAEKHSTGTNRRDNFEQR
jgi:dynactin complex subunit